MNINMKSFAKYYWPYSSYLLLALSAYVSNNFAQQYLVLAVVMLLLPMLDGGWKAPTTDIDSRHASLWIAMIVIAMAVISLKPDLLTFLFATLIFAALPEEWFFRAYLMERIGNGMKANVIASICFSALHAITLNWVSSLLVFIPSLLFGWIYQKQRNIVTVVLIHSVSNLIYTAYLYRYFERFYYL